MTSTNYEENIKIIANLGSESELAKILNINYAQFINILHTVPKKDSYEVFSIPKKGGGEREITAPIGELKIFQEKLNLLLQSLYKPKASVHGFSLNRSILTNAKRHVSRRKKFVYNVDIKDFFPSITYPRIKGLFLAIPYNFSEKIATTLAQICCHNNQLPQGAPTSPIISNMLCARMDSQLTRLAQTSRCTYTRYADDISFSTSLAKFPESLITEIQTIIIDNGFQLNSRKTRLMPKSRRQEITGLVINEFPNVKRPYIRNIRAMLHDWEIHGLESASLNHNLNYQKIHDVSNFKDFRKVLHGKIEFIRYIKGERDLVFQKLYKKAKQLEISSLVEEEKNYL